MKTTSKNFNNSHFLFRCGHGGILAQGKRKNRRLLSLRKPMLFALETTALENRYHLHARKNSEHIHEILRRQAKKFEVQLLEKRICRGSIELRLRAKQREHFQQFLRSITALIARKITGARKGHKFGKFWSGLAYSLVIRLSEEFQVLVSNMELWREAARVTPFLRI